MTCGSSYPQVLTREPAGCTRTRPVPTWCVPGRVQATCSVLENPWVAPGHTHGSPYSNLRPTPKRARTWHTHVMSIAASLPLPYAGRVFNMSSLSNSTRKPGYNPWVTYGSTNPPTPVLVPTRILTPIQPATQNT